MLAFQQFSDVWGHQAVYVGEVGLCKVLKVLLRK